MFPNQGFLQWNCRGFRNSAQEIQVVLNRYCPLTICLQESKLRPDLPCTLKGYSVFRKDLVTDTVAHGRVILAVHHSAGANEVALKTDLQAVAARMQLDCTSITICSIYLPPGIVFTRNELVRLVLELPPPFLVFGDLTLTTLCGLR